MQRQELKNIIADCCNDVIFTYNGKKSGVTSEVHDSIPTFQAWHGSVSKEYSNLDEVLNDKFYSGKSLYELSDGIEFTFA